MLVFRPLSTDELRALGRGDELTVHFAFASTPEFLDTFGLSHADDEDAERTLLYLAGLAALQRHGRRLVAVADLHARNRGNAIGVVTADGLRMAQVSALFADEPAAQRLADAVVPLIKTQSLEDAWDHPSHEALLKGADLLWYGPEEWPVLTGDTVAAHE